MKNKINNQQTRSNSVQGDEVGNTLKQNGTHKPSVSSSADIKEKVLRKLGYEIIEDGALYFRNPEGVNQIRFEVNAIELIKAIEETSKAKDEEFDKILDDLKEKMTFEEERYEHTYTNKLLIFFEEKVEEIKQRRKEE